MTWFTTPDVDLDGPADPTRQAHWDEIGIAAQTERIRLRDGHVTPEDPDTYQALLAWGGFLSINPMGRGHSGPAGKIGTYGADPGHDLKQAIVYCLGTSITPTRAIDDLAAGWRAHHIGLVAFYAAWSLTHPGALMRAQANQHHTGSPVDRHVGDTGRLMLRIIREPDVPISTAMAWAPVIAADPTDDIEPTLWAGHLRDWVRLGHPNATIPAYRAGLTYQEARDLLAGPLAGPQSVPAPATLNQMASLRGWPLPPTPPTVLHLA